MEPIYDTPARRDSNLESVNNTAAYIKRATSELEQLFESVDRYEKENPGKTYGYAGLPGVLHRVREAGIDKIFFVGREYHGRYEDDDCYFSYWDEEKHEFFGDEWSTRFAAPSYNLYEMPIAFSAGWETGMIDKEAYLENLKNRNLSMLEHAKFDRELAKEYNLRVKIERGRKWKGEGYLVNVTSSSYRFATPMFRTHNRDYGISTTYTAVVWDPITNMINRANFNYVEFMDEEKIMREYKAWAEKKIIDATIADVRPNGKSLLSWYMLDIDYSLIKFMSEVWAPNHNIGDVMATAYDPEEEERKKKASEFRASKMPGIIDWVKNNTDKKDEEIMELALHIFNKKYNN